MHASVNTTSGLGFYLWTSNWVRVVSKMPINGVKSEFLMGRKVAALCCLPKLSQKASKTSPPAPTPWHLEANKATTKA